MTFLIDIPNLANESKGKEFASEVERLIHTESEGRKKVVETLEDLANEIDKEVRKARIAKTTFASSGILGSGLAIGGIIAAPFTFGASLGLTIAGVALGVSSGVGGLVTTIIDRLLNSKKTKAAYAAADQYINITDCIVTIFEKIRNEWNGQIEQDFQDKLRTISDPETSKTLEVFLQSMKATSEVGAAGAKIAFTSVALASRTLVADVSRTVGSVLKTGTLGLTIGGAVLAAFTIPIDVYTIYTNKASMAYCATELEELRDGSIGQTKVAFCSTYLMDEQEFGGTGTRSTPPETLNRLLHTSGTRRSSCVILGCKVLRVVLSGRNDVYRRSSDSSQCGVLLRILTVAIQWQGNPGVGLWPDHSRCGETEGVRAGGSTNTPDEEPTVHPQHQTGTSHLHHQQPRGYLLS